jgi:hypothetical protein
MTITTGFITGNLIGDATNLDESATAASYAELLTAAIETAYPDAKVSVNYQSAYGEIPIPLTTHVDGDTDTDDCRDIDAIAVELFAMGDFYVNA